MNDFRQGWVPRWFEEMDKLEFQICLVAGKENSKIKLKQYYRQLLQHGGQASVWFASYIIKGSRNPVIGYKPQLMHSKNSFITSMTVPNPSAYAKIPDHF